MTMRIIFLTTIITNVLYYFKYKKLCVWMLVLNNAKEDQIDFNKTIGIRNTQVYRVWNNIKDYFQSQNLH